MGRDKTIINYRVDPDTGEKIYSNQKITFKTAVQLFEEIYKDVLDNEDLISIKVLINSPKYRDRDIRYQRLWHYCEKYPKCKEINEEIIELIKERIMLGALTGKYKENFSKWLLVSLYGMDAEKKDININENIKFQFGNPELIGNIKNKELNKHIEDITFEEEEVDEED